MILNEDFRRVIGDLPQNTLTVTDPPYNIGFKYNKYKDNKQQKEYQKLLSKIPKPCVIIHYPEETIREVIPAMGESPTKMMFWCYHSHLPRAIRIVSFFGIKPDLRKYKIPYYNNKDKRIEKLIAEGKKGRAIREWFIVEQVKGHTKEHKEYGNQIPEKVIDIILTVCEEQFETVFDPFMGSGTTLKVAQDKGYKYIGTDIDEKAVEITKRRLKERQLKL
jgi:site-specific DNA-methyltransferase (adenine-specific)